MDATKIFIIHYSKLKERKAHILNQLEKHGITEFQFIEINNPENMNPNYIQKMNKDLKIGVKSLNCKHLFCYDLIANSSIGDKYKYFFILEDDVFLQDNFINILNNYLLQLPEDYDMFFIGNGCNLHTNPYLIKPNCNVYRNNSSRCADSYFISKSCAKKMLDFVLNNSNLFNCAIDWIMNYAAIEKNLIYYWAEPTIVCQGSQNGTFQQSY